MPTGDGVRLRGAGPVRPRTVPSEKISSAVRPRISRRGRPRNFSAEALTSTTRESRVNSMSPSCSLVMTCSTLSFRAEKIWFVSRICRPRWAIFSDTRPTSSPALVYSSGSRSPALAVSRFRAMAFRGPSATLETTAERTSEQKLRPPKRKLPAAVSESVRCAGKLSRRPRERCQTPARRVLVRCSRHKRWPGRRACATGGGSPRRATRSNGGDPEPACHSAPDSCRESQLHSCQ